MSKRQPAPLPRITFTIAEVAEMTGTSDEHVLKQILRGVLRGVRFGGRILIPADAVGDALKPMTEGDR